MSIIFPGKIERENTIILDGYSNKKTLESAIKDFGRFIEKKFHNNEGNALISMVNDGISETNNPFCPASGSEGGYFFEWQEVERASKYDNLTESIEYEDASYYFVIRFFK